MSLKTHLAYVYVTITLLAIKILLLNCYSNYLNVYLLLDHARGSAREYVGYRGK